MFKRSMFFILSCVLGACPIMAESGKPKITAEKVDPKKPVGSANDNCVIFYQDGKPYRICPFSIPEDVKAAIREQENQ